MKTLAALLYALIILFLVLLFSGCGSQAAGLEESAKFRYAPDEKAAPYFEAVRVRFLEVAGIELVADPTGTPIRFLTDLPSDGPLGYDCGQTPITFMPEPFSVAAVEVKILYPPKKGCDSLRASLTHEIIHSLRRDLVVEDNAAKDQGHATSGVFYKHSGDRFDEASLNKVCEAVDCPIYNPEE